RSVTIRPGVEDAEIVRFLAVLDKAKHLAADAPDDLLTLLWSEDFPFIAYTFRELAAENAVPIEAGETIPSAPPSEIRHAVEQEAPPRPEGIVSIEEFDTTLYFLEEREVEYLHKEAEREYAQDLRRNVLAMLFDLLELQTYGTVRAELIGIVENFIPYLLGAGDFRSVAYILREVCVLLERARDLIPEHPGATNIMVQRLEADEHELKLAVVDAITQIASPSALRLLEGAVDDGDRDVRIAAVKFLASRGHRNALARVESAVMGAKLRDTDLTEKMAFYEAYGTL